LAEVTEVLPDFDGFGVCYDTAANPYFKAIFVENIRLIQSVRVGKKLLKLIADARPKFRGTFPIGINVMAKPQKIKYIQSGHLPYFGAIMKAPDGVTKYDAPRGCNHYLVGSSANAAINPIDSTNSQGSVCDMMFTNAQFISSRGEQIRPHIVLAHELIHSYHCLYGIKKNDDEELWASGIGKYDQEPISENVFRKQFKIPLRTEYY
jgi:hypothetical protein